ncbi:MAG: hypothetical protein IJA34_05445 [Lachnospiraceae bacterium]|nr:hypothetical protein [Lachnospiraceae bacterium]
MKKKLLGFCLSGVMVITVVATGIAYAANIAIKNYTYNDGVVIRNEHGNHSQKKWDASIFTEIKSEYDVEMKKIDSRSSVVQKQTALKNAEALLDAMTEELQNQVASSKTEQEEKKVQEEYIKDEYIRLGQIRTELYPLNEKEEIVKKATALREQIEWEKSINEDNESMLLVLNVISNDVDNILKEIENAEIKTLDEFETARNALFEKRTELEKSSGITHLSENDI